MCILAPKSEKSLKKWPQYHDSHQKPDTKYGICYSEPLVSVEPRDLLLAIPWTVCNGLERFWHGFRRVWSAETTQTSVEAVYACSEVRAPVPSRIIFKMMIICSESQNR